MADFIKSYLITEKMEGGYSNNPNDKGKETYCGISRVAFPDWKGWAFLDKQAHPIQNNAKFSYLNRDVEQFYRVEFWTKLNCGLMAQDVANQLYDYAVNSGKVRAAKSLQSVLNNRGSFLDVDGAIGIKTLTALKRFDSSDIAKALFVERENFINKLIVSQPYFKRVWLNRLSYLRSFLTVQNTVLPALVVGSFVLLFFLTKSKAK
jgi:lysozyme family protein